MNPARRDETRHLTFRDVMDRFGIGRTALYGWLSDETMAFPKPFKINGRNYFRESEIVEFEAACGKDEDVERALGFPVCSQVITDYLDFIAAMRARKVDLGLSNDELEIRTGLAEGHVSKLENYGKPDASPSTVRGMGPATFPLWLGGLRVGIVLVDLPRRKNSSLKRRTAAAREARA